MQNRSARPTLIVCPCGENVRTWLRGRGCWHVAIMGFLTPVVTVGIYVMILVFALTPSDIPPVARVLIGLIIPSIFALTMVALAVSRHRGWCLVKRSTYYFFVWPGAALLALPRIAS